MSELPELPKPVVGNVGMYYACYRLSQEGWNVMPTARNAKGIDIVAYSQDGKEMIGIQVKTVSKNHNIRLGASLEKVMGDWWIIVYNAVTNAPSASIMRPEEVKNLAHEFSTEYGLPPSVYGKPEFHERWDRIGRGDK